MAVEPSFGDPSEAAERDGPPPEREPEPRDTGDRSLVISLSINRN